MNNRYNSRSRSSQNNATECSCANARRTSNNNISSANLQANTEEVNFSSLAMVYGISQSWNEIDDSECGFERGTIFDELYKPFLGYKCPRS